MDTVSNSVTTTRTTTVVAEDFAQFRTAVSESFVPLQVTSDSPDTFSGRLRNLMLDNIHVSEVTASRHTVERTPALIARGDPPYYKINLQIAGTGLLIQDNREAVLQPGDLAIYDTDRPYSLVFDDNFSVVVVMFPRHLLEVPAAVVGEMTAVRIKGDQGLGQVVAPFLAQFANNLGQFGPATSARLANTALDLVSTMVVEELDLEGSTGDPHRTLMHQIHAYIEAHLGSTDLGPASIAAAHFISTRHLHALFREQDTTVSSWIRARRLEHCRRDLVDPMQGSRPVALVAARWGFVDAAHFSRVFKATFGQSPSELRQTSRSV
ncbi:MAG TPA: helix-turn-helix domain-containing protein [Pseudolysinimonas sp.]|nr:helix-turn-helix domain-containing protein [Pseudolysinimonas sp.]